MITSLPPSLYDEAIALWQRVGLTRPWNDPAADLRRAMDGPASTVLAVLEDGVLSATAMVGHDGHRGWMYYLAVDPSSQGRGLGRALVRACEEWVSARGLPKLMLMVRRGNDSVLGFYASLGYEENEVVTLGRFLDAPSD